jgi:hypothetical protein
MFSFFKKKTAPEKIPANPGLSHEAKVAFANGERTWSEEFNVVKIAAAVLRQHGHSVANHTTWLLHKDSGFMIMPMLVELQPLEGGGVRTATTVQINHPS